MTGRRAAGLVDVDAPRAARVIAQGLVDDVLRAAARHDAGPGRDTVHDTRVAMRRLRSWLRVHRPLLEATGRGRAARALQRAGEASGSARDAEVFGQWLTRPRAPLPAPARSAGRWLLAHWGAPSAPADAEPLLPLVDAPLRRLRGRVQRYAQSVDIAAGPAHHAFGVWTATVLRTQRDVLRARLAAVSVADDAVAAHRVRVAIKQLRYTVEPVAAEVAEARALIRACKAAQDALGELQDAQVALAMFTTVMGDAARAAPPAAAAAGVPVLAAALASRLQAAWQAAMALVEGPQAIGLLSAIDAVADALEAAVRRGTEIERKYLCTRLPALPPGTSQQLIEQGYLPGTELIERVRRVREGRRTMRFRTVKVGRGLQRLEVEERCSAALFRALWPFTEGRRVIKRRHVVVDGPHTWVIDQFTDRELVLVEIELPRADTVVTLPPWLATVVAREVTDDSAFVNAVLAC